ncbi:hypothetical protein Desor_1767 [Desulfosporosinus orientis DSM 765]|uniref:Uncharacterized protein n=1 Tax=Desulfosporosinus orientis (strain ATCC 19365 / DSM 765 / NCIMB 8382 / VKM B-1628 / Singapore I) TaxID=768706 RepID=G7W8H7_DESOD|nr:hypothetical protein [Desulfosporosinus orientis]AET67404.1 hypothetical protein Desor_1767 [Desulfosporosinus orientis DSM 765]
MKRTEILLRQRERLLTNVLESKENRAKWLTELMDIDDEIEEMEKKRQRAERRCVLNAV